MDKSLKTRQYVKFCAYGFLKNLRFFDAFILLFFLEKGLSFTEIGILYAVREVAIFVFEVPSGFVSDGYGRKNALLLSFIANICSFLVFYFFNNFGLYLIAFTLYGIADAFRSGTHKGIIMDYLRQNSAEHQKIDYYGHTRSWSQKGSALSSLIAGCIVFFGGNYQSIFLYSTLPYVLNFILILSYPSSLNKSPYSKKKDNKSSFTQVIQAFLSSMKTVNVLRIVNTSAMHTAYMRSVKDYIQPLLVNISLVTPILLAIKGERKSALIIGLLYFVIYLLTSLASKNAAGIAKRDKGNLAFITLLIGFGAGAISGVFYASGWWVVAIFPFVAIYIIENIRKPILTGYVADNVPTDILTSVLSAQELWRTIITACLSFVFGILADWLDIGFALILLSGILALFTLLFSFVFRNSS